MGWYQRRVHGEKVGRILKLIFVLLMKSHLQSYPCPLQINFFWNFGFLLGITIILQIITGIFLGLHYTSDLNSYTLLWSFFLTLLLSNAAVSLGDAFISLEISSQFFIFFSLFSFILAWTFISLQIKEFRIMGLSINDSVYSCLFFFLTGLHFFHLSFGLFLSCLLFWSCSFPFHFFKKKKKKKKKK